MAIALIVAAGSGERLGAGRPKALVQLAGRPLLRWSVDALAAAPAIEAIVVALPPGADTAAAPPGTVGVAGGRTRSESVRNALAAAPPGDPVLVHDAARPLVTAELAERVIAGLEQAGTAQGAIAAAAVTDTIKRAAGENPPAVAETLDRSTLWAVQTPQVFRRSALERALAAPDAVLARASDDAWLVERAGGKVVIVPAAAENLKVTTAVDLELAELLLARRSA
jgi:2-C-methyl-D-erythritol 4-phosphate cytidylyltransferase